MRPPAAGSAIPRLVGWLLLAAVFCAHGWQCVAEDHSAAAATHSAGHAGDSGPTMAMPMLGLDQADAVVSGADEPAASAHPIGVPTPPPVHPLTVHLALFAGALVALVLIAVRSVAVISRAPPRRPDSPGVSSTPFVALVNGRQLLSLLCVSRT